MRLIQPSRFQMSFLTVLTVCVIAWLLLLTGFREYWGFWQSKEVYGFLRKEYPQWMREYISGTYGATLSFTLTVYAGWLLLSVRELRAVLNTNAFYRQLALILLVSAFLSGTLGVMCANNFINLLDHGKLHGDTHLQVRE